MPVILVPKRHIVRLIMEAALSKKSFIVNIKMFIGEYEKNIKKYIEAKTEKEAMYQALCGVSHNEVMTFDEYNSGKDWWDDDMIYVASAREVPDELALVLKKFERIIF